MYIFICIYICTYICIYRNIYIYFYICIYIHLYIYVNIHMYICVYIHVQVTGLPPLQNAYSTHGQTMPVLTTKTRQKFSKVVSLPTGPLKTTITLTFENFYQHFQRLYRPHLVLRRSQDRVGVGHALCQRPTRLFSTYSRCAVGFGPFGHWRSTFALVFWFSEPSFAF